MQMNKFTWFKGNLALAFAVAILGFSYHTDVTAKQPKVPQITGEHRFEFVEAKTNYKRRVYKTHLLVGIEIWHSDKYNYVHHGPFYSLNPDGSVSGIINWSYGQKEGRSESYRNGFLYEEGQYINGDRVGVWSWHNAPGRLYKTTTYLNGRKDGKEIEYNLEVKMANQPLRIKHFQNGKEHGSFEEYNDYGSKITLGNYVNGRKEGSWKERGRTVNYVNGKEIK